MSAHAEDTAATTYATVRAAAIPLLAGVVLRARDISAGNGKVIDWRTVKSGVTIQDDGDAFDTAALFVALVGAAAALAAVAAAVGDVPDESPPTLAMPHVTAFAPGYDGGRRRAFAVGPFEVRVEPHEDDAAQAAFTARLAEVASSLV